MKTKITHTITDMRIAQWSTQGNPCYEISIKSEWDNYKYLRTNTTILPSSNSLCIHNISLNWNSVTKEDLGIAIKIRDMLNKCDAEFNTMNIADKSCLTLLRRECSTDQIQLDRVDELHRQFEAQFEKSKIERLAQYVQEHKAYK